MKRLLAMGALTVWITALLCGCATAAQPKKGGATPALANDTEVIAMENVYTVDTKITDVIGDPVFGDYGRLIFPADSGYWSGDTLGDLRLTWYNNIDPAKEDTGLFFFKGNPGERFAVCNAGGGFAYVGAMHDSFPHALELSKMGYNAFALIYRPGAQTACEDLARAIAFIFAHAEELEVDTACYSLWGGSAGGRMAAYLGSYGPMAFGGGNLFAADKEIMGWLFGMTNKTALICPGGI